MQKNTSVQPPASKYDFIYTFFMLTFIFFMVFPNKEKFFQKMTYFISQNASISILNILSDLQSSNTVSAPWITWFSLFPESPGADRAGSLVAKALPWWLLFRTTGKGLCLSRPTPPPASLTWPVYSESFSPVQLHICLPCPSGHHATFYLAVPCISRS